MGVRVDEGNWVGYWTDGLDTLWATLSGMVGYLSGWWAALDVTMVVLTFQDWRLLRSHLAKFVENATEQRYAEEPHGGGGPELGCPKRLHQWILRVIE